MKKCKSCQTQIDNNAKKCPHCRADQRNWFARHPILTGILVLIIIGMFASAGGAGKESTSTQTSTTNTNNSESTKASDQTEELTPKVGDVTKLGDREFIVDSVKRSGAFNYNTPKAGKEYVIVTVTIKNLGSDEVTYNPYDFKVQDAKGAQESLTFATLDDSLSSGTLAPKGTVTGSIPFEVTIGDQAKLIFQPGFWNTQRVVVDLGNK